MMNEYKEKTLVIPDVETQFDDLNREIAYWKTQAITLRVRNEKLQREVRVMQELINIEYGIDG
jgi:hypothetical protein